VEKAGTLLLESLLPGRNYSISVQAISNGMESNETSIYQATREYALSM
jgi:cadherin 5 type 2 (VE-cadherin)